MNHDHDHSDQTNHMQLGLPVCPEPGISPLGWSIAGRLLWALGALALLWLGVAWAIGLL